MRADIKKVLAERPRRGSTYGYKDFRQRENHGDYDDLPNHQGMKRPYGWDTKDSTTLLGPLHRFLHGSVGRRWDDVWSELCHGLGDDQYLRRQALWVIETHTFVADGKVYCRGSQSGGGTGTIPVGLYVDPRDGLIHHNDNYHRRRPYKIVKVDGLGYYLGVDGILYPTSTGGWRTPKARYPLKVIDDRRAMRIDGIWYWIEFAQTPPVYAARYVQNGKEKFRKVYSPRYDFVTGEFVQEGRYHADKHQMASRELRRHGLRNLR